MVTGDGWHLGSETFGEMLFFIFFLKTCFYFSFSKIKNKKSILGRSGIQDVTRYLVTRHPKVFKQITNQSVQCTASSWGSSSWGATPFLQSTFHTHSCVRQIRIDTANTFSFILVKKIIKRREFLFVQRVRLPWLSARRVELWGRWFRFAVVEWLYIKDL